jgi:hypothetical protein
MREHLVGCRWIAVALLLAGCYTGGSAPAPLSNTTPPPATAGGRWIARAFTTTQLPLHGGAAQNQLETLTLEWHGMNATLVIEERSADFTRDTEIGPWRAGRTRRLTGRVEMKGRVIAFDFRGDRGGEDAIAFPCVRDSIEAAAATAVRKPSPASEECGDTGRWVPAATTRISILRCRQIDADGSLIPGDEEWDHYATLAFARGPGVEWLHVNDDCIMQGGGWRAVPTDGSIAAPR